MTTPGSVDFDFNLIKKGNKKAFQRIFEQQYKPMVNFAYRIIREQQVCEEIVQEVFIYLWEKKETIEIRSSLTSYLYSAVKNKCINYIKLELPKNQATMDIENAGISIEMKDFDHRDSQQLAVFIDQAIKSLPPKCRNIFLLSRSGGLTYEEIAEDLNISIKTVENQMSIALKKLRQSLAPAIKRINEEND